ncbi:hypothetical protein F5050DRAFT_1757486 [Lentinula boryana]|uniref:Secreted protein n=1 Tax=Lentinula boryana TaxID=40481 RepID=A0ABQ8QDT0_9AGAR|nr:hypothetical protein F5050DRAFT_1757486 [Lentinula boryana]
MVSGRSRLSLLGLVFSDQVTLRRSMSFINGIALWISQETGGTSQYAAVCNFNFEDQPFVYSCTANRCKKSTGHHGL